MKAYLAIKFHEDCRNRKLIGEISEVLKGVGIDIGVMARDCEKWGEVKFDPDELMRLAFKMIDGSELLIVEASESGVGTSIEAGYAYAKSKPIIVIARQGSDISNTLRGIAKEVFFYEGVGELAEMFRSFFSVT